MQRLEVSDVVRPIYGSLGVKQLILLVLYFSDTEGTTPATGHDILEVPFAVSSHN